MSAEPYFRAAAAELRKAVVEKRHEIEMRRKQISELEQQTRQQVDELNRDKNLKQAQSASGDINNNQRIELERQAIQDQNHIVDIERSAGQQKDALNQEIANLQRDMMDIEQTANALESRS